MGRHEDRTSCASKGCAFDDSQAKEASVGILCALRDHELEE
jgi:hypothetical protein